MQMFTADGRAILDPAGFTRANANYGEVEEDDWMRYSRRERGGDLSVDVVLEGVAMVDEDQMWRCWPTIKGFSLAAKRWGEFFVSQSQEVEYRTGAFHTLVLDAEKKEMIVAAVDNTTSRSAFTDVVKGKGGGCVFLLHGPPGVGKTLTAEATAEYLKRPLYTLTSGELGTSPTELEANLAKALDLAAAWDAVLLIDECDIFLQARNTEDVTRNAMVGIFLRLLEYHTGVLFLTTNRVDVFDSAVYSRISVALEYKPLSTENRKAVWLSLLCAAQVKPDQINVGALAEIPANGRQIKNAVRLAISLASNDTMNACTADFEKAVRVAQDFAALTPCGVQNDITPKQVVMNNTEQHSS